FWALVMPLSTVAGSPHQQQSPMIPSPHPQVLDQGDDRLRHLCGIMNMDLNEYRGYWGPRFDVKVFESTFAMFDENGGMISIRSTWGKHCVLEGRYGPINNDVVGNYTGYEVGKCLYDRVPKHDEGVRIFKVLSLGWGNSGVRGASLQIECFN
ncbi:hypothetical protein BC829DRAFT_406270, partial [Chytridium lagenaria]